MTDPPDSSLKSEERTRILRSSWISRLRLRPPHSTGTSGFGGGGGGGVLGKKHTISTDESSSPVTISGLNSSAIFRRRISFLPKNPLPALLPLPWVKGGGGESELFTGFGPFQVRTRKTLPQRAEGNLEPGNLGFCEGKQLESVTGKENLDERSLSFPGRRVPDERAGVGLSPFFQFNHRLTTGYVDNYRAGASVELARDKGFSGPVGEGNTKFADSVPSSSSWTQSHLGPAQNGNKGVPLSKPYLHTQELANESSSRRPYEQHLSVDPLLANSSFRYIVRSRGTAYRDRADDPSASRTICDLHALHPNTVQCHFKRQTPEEPFSYWNMGRCKRSNFVSSVSPATALTMNLGVKRNLNTDDFISSKSRKLGSED